MGTDVLSFLIGFGGVLLVALLGYALSRLSKPPKAESIWSREELDDGTVVWWSDDAMFIGAP